MVFYLTFCPTFWATEPCSGTLLSLYIYYTVSSLYSLQGNADFFLSFRNISRVHNEKKQRKIKRVCPNSPFLFLLLLLLSSCFRSRGEQSLSGARERSIVTTTVLSDGDVTSQPDSCGCFWRKTVDVLFCSLYSAFPNLSRPFDTTIAPECGDPAKMKWMFKEDHSLGNGI